MKLLRGFPFEPLDIPPDTFSCGDGGGAGGSLG